MSCLFWCAVVGCGRVFLALFFICDFSLLFASFERNLETHIFNIAFNYFSH